jgi:peptidoglycan glycosyltransferase
MHCSFRRLIDMATNKTPEGASVQTTIVPKIQKAAADALGNQKGACCGTGPKTGAVLALVTSPTYDPNDIASP